jgi:hypothetical protein
MRVNSLSRGKYSYFWLLGKKYSYLCLLLAIKHLRASPTYCQIELPSLIFVKKLKILLHQFVKRFDNFWQLGENQPPTRKYRRAKGAWHCFLQVGGCKGNKIEKDSRCKFSLGGRG